MVFNYRIFTGELLARFSKKFSTSIGRLEAGFSRFETNIGRLGGL